MQHAVLFTFKILPENVFEKWTSGKKWTSKNGLQEKNGLPKMDHRKKMDFEKWTSGKKWTIMKNGPPKKWTKCKHFGQAPCKVAG